jgi:hypothetical protein
MQELRAKAAEFLALSRREREAALHRPAVRWRIEAEGKLLEHDNVMSLRPPDRDQPRR